MTCNLPSLSTKSLRRVVSQITALNTSIENSFDKDRVNVLTRNACGDEGFIKMSCNRRGSEATRVFFPTIEIVIQSIVVLCNVN